MSDLALPAIGLGTSGMTGDECVESVRAALETGYRHIDTAQMYDNEPAVGAGIRLADVDREDVVLASKVHPENLAYEDAKRTAEESLVRLGVDRLDMLYVHWPTNAYEAEETLRAMDELHDAGVTRHVCVSNFTPELLDEARDILDADIAANQVECHPLLPQDELRADAAEDGHTLVGYAPLGQGKIFDVPELQQVAERHSTSPAAVCIAWAIRKDALVPIPKASTEEHLEANVAASRLELTDEDMATIDGIEEQRRLIDPDRAAWNQ
ncbi:MAG: aldo/keto reductase [Halolamina sp.]|uniref:aldo/keto reductase n=1 Tax=Halolamina sp. TaxID=1940283 RepID=UPI002FC2E123